MNAGELSHSQQPSAQHQNDKTTHVRERHHMSVGSVYGLNLRHSACASSVPTCLLASLSAVVATDCISTRPTPPGVATNLG